MNLSRIIQYDLISDYWIFGAKLLNTKSSSDYLNIFNSPYANLDTFDEDFLKKNKVMVHTDIQKRQKFFTIKKESVLPKK